VKVETFRLQRGAGTRKGALIGSSEYELHHDWWFCRIPEGPNPALAQGHPGGVVKVLITLITGQD
jgi:hypothetical protein